jgi:hypothetical protein
MISVYALRRNDKERARTMGKRRDDEEYCPLYTTVARSRKTHESLKSRLQNTPRFNCTKITDAYWAACPVDSEEDDALTLPGPGVTLLPPRVDRPYSGTAYTKIWVESAAPRSIQYIDGRVFPWEWGFNPSRWGAFVEWLPLDGSFEWDMLRVRVEKMSGLDAVGTAELLDYARRGAWMFEYYMAMYFSLRNLLSFFFAPPVERAAVEPITTVLTAARSWSRKLLPMGKSLRLVEGGFQAEKKHYQVTNTLVDWGETSVKRMSPLVTVEALSLLKTSSAGGSLSSSA